MENPLIKAGAIFTILGFFMIVGSIVVMILGVVADKENTLESTESDFISTSEGTYEYSLNSDRVAGKISIEIMSRSRSAIELTVRVIDHWGVEIYDQPRTTPAKIDIDVSGERMGSYDIMIIFKDKNQTMEDLEVEVYGSSLSNRSMALCCLGSIMPIIGGTLLLMGILLMIGGFVKNFRDRRKKARKRRKEIRKKARSIRKKPHKHHSKQNEKSVVRHPVTHPKGKKRDQTIHKNVPREAPEPPKFSY